MSSSRFRYPIYLDLVDRPTIVIGAGEVGIRKVESLLEAGAKVTVFDENADPEINDFLKKYKGYLIWYPKNYTNESLEPYYVVVSATNDPAIQNQIEAEAKKLGKLLNVVDVPSKCTFIVPSIYKQEELLVAISTGGTAPAFSKYLRQKLEKEWGSEYGVLVKQLSAFREKINKIGSQPVRRALWEQIFALDPLALVKSGQKDWVQKVEQWISSATV